MENISLSKIVFWLSIMVCGTGTLLLLPDQNGSWMYVHILAAVLLAWMLFVMISSHVTVHLSNPFKSGIKKWNGFKYIFYLSLTFGSGIWIIIGLPGSWVKNFHLGIAFWSLLVGWKHKKGKRV